MNTILTLNGPNLNLLGTREKDIYGSQTLADIEADMTGKAAELGVVVEFFQSNSEGKIVDRVQEAASNAQGLIVNPGALTHYSISLRDALLAVDLPTIEVHISNIQAREDFRAESVISDIVIGQINGLGGQGYLYALEWLARYLA